MADTLSLVREFLVAQGLTATAAQVRRRPALRSGRALLCDPAAGLTIRRAARHRDPRAAQARARAARLQAGGSARAGDPAGRAVVAQAAARRRGRRRGGGGSGGVHVPAAAGAADAGHPDADRVVQRGSGRPARGVRHAHLPDSHLRAALGHAVRGLRLHPLGEPDAQGGRAARGAARGRPLGLLLLDGHVRAVGRHAPRQGRRRDRAVRRLLRRHLPPPGQNRQPPRPDRAVRRHGRAGGRHQPEEGHLAAHPARHARVPDQPHAARVRPAGHLRGRPLSQRPRLGRLHHDVAAPVPPHRARRGHRRALGDQGAVCRGRSCV